MTNLSRVSAALSGLLFAAFALLSPTAANACGGFFCSLNNPVDQAGERIIFAVEGEKVTAHIQIQYQGTADAFSWVLPLPSVPDVQIGSDEVFNAVRRQTDPRFVIEWQNEEGCDFTNSCPCMMDAAESTGGSPTGAGGAVDVLASGEVGPFDFKVVSSDDPGALFDWLNENGYDQPPTARPLIEQYVEQGMVFLGLQLLKDKEAGDIQPVVLSYEAPSLACIPIRLTSIAAQPDMPIYSWVLGASRAIPLNYFHVTLNPKAFDWMNCGTAGPESFDFCGGFNNTGVDCDKVYLDLVTEAASSANGHGFVTEFAGASSIMKDQIHTEGRYDTDRLREMSGAFEFYQDLLSQGFPRSALMQSIIGEHIPKPDEDSLPQECRDDSSFYAVWNMGECLEHMPDDFEFDAAAFADDLAERIVKPLADAQALFDRVPYLTRMFTTLSPDEMTRDPFFSFNPDLGDVSNEHRVVARATCKPGSSNEAESVTLTFPDGSTSTLTGEFQRCGGWEPGGENPLLDAAAAAEVQVLEESGDATSVSADEVEGWHEQLGLRTPTPGMSEKPPTGNGTGEGTGTFGSGSGSEPTPTEPTPTDGGGGGLCSVGGTPVSPVWLVVFLGGLLGLTRRRRVA